MDDLDATERGTAKRDRTARLMRVASLLVAHPDGMRPKDIAERLGMSVRNVYRDLRALEGEVGLPMWSNEGRWGLLDTAFLPPLKLTLSEAMAVFLGARLMVRYADKYDPDLGSAFEKLAANLPETLREHVARSLDVLQDAPLDPDFIDHVRPFALKTGLDPGSIADDEPSGEDRDLIDAAEDRWSSDATRFGLIDPRSS